MPYSAVHFELGLKVKKRLQSHSDFLDFLVGNIFVDISYILNSYSINISRAKTHFYEEGKFESANFEKAFKDETQPFNAFHAGYYAHLAVDKIWRDSSFVRKVYQNPTLEGLYQLSRKFYALKDIRSLTQKKRVQKIVEDLYEYKIKIEKIPYIFQSFDEEILQKAYIEMLDYMFGRKVFFKNTETKVGYTINQGRLKITDKQLKKDLKALFSYEEYLRLKQKGLEKMKTLKF